MNQEIIDVGKSIARATIGQGRTQELVGIFAPLYAEAREAMTETAAIHVTDASDKPGIARAKAGRARLSAIRIQSDKARKKEKESALREGQAIQDIYNNIAALIEPEEKRLRELEEFIERQEAHRKAAIKLDRENILKPLGVDVRFIDLAAMPAEAFDAMLRTAQDAQAKRADDERKHREEREAAEAKEAAERERHRLENAKLKAEAEAREEAARKERLAEQVLRDIERQKHQAALDVQRKTAEEDAAVERAAAAERERAEREARLKAEDEARSARLEREAAAKRERDAAAEVERKKRALAAAPDAEKISAYCEAFAVIPLPCCDSAGGREIARGIGTAREHFIVAVAAQVLKLAGGES